jgi:hypothetical protein
MLGRAEHRLNDALYVVVGRGECPDIDAEKEGDRGTDLARKIHTNDLVYSCAMALLLLGYVVTTITIRQKEGHRYVRL